MTNTPLRLAFGLLFAFASSSLVACGGDDGTADAGETGETAETAETADTDMPTCMGADSTRADTILALTPDEAAGAMVFANSCGLSACHGADGISGTGPSLAVEIPEYPSDALVCLLLSGFGTMPSQAALSDQQLADVIAYVETTF